MVRPLQIHRKGWPMFKDRLVFSQLMDFFPKHDFNKCVHRYHGNHRVKTFSCLDQFLCLAFAQLTFRESLRDIETCLRAIQPKLYHAGIRGKVSRSTLAEANEKYHCFTARPFRYWKVRLRQLYLQR